MPTPPAHTPITTCNTQFDLQKPTSQGWEGRGFGRRYYFYYRCPVCGNTTKVGASAFSGKNPVPAVGAILCPHLRGAR